jgi:glycosyltransferase involved in cell wall biosynthesis
MNVLHVIADMDPVQGGVCQAVRTIIGGLAEQDVHSEVVSLDLPSAAFLVEDTAKIHALGPGKGPWRYSSPLLPWLLSNLSSFDTVLVHGLWLYPGFAVSKAIKQLQESSAPVVPRLYVMPHGMLDPYFQKAETRKWKALRNVLYWKLLENKLIDRAEALLFTCEAELLLARQPFRPYKPKREQVVGLGVSEPPPYQATMRSAFLAHCPDLDSQPYILYLGRIHEKKGADLLLQAYIKLAEDFDNAWRASDEIKNDALQVTARKPNWSLPKLVIAGPGLGSPYEQQLQKMVRENSIIRSSVFFPGMLTGDAKWGAYYGCEAFALPSHQENFGIAVVEALACSKPVLISNQVNIWREIQISGAGLVANDTLDGISFLLKMWVNLSQKAKMEIGEQSRKAYHKYFAVEPAASRIKETLFKSLK